MTDRIFKSDANIAVRGRMGRLLLGVLPVFFCLLLLGMPVKRAEAAGATISISTKNTDAVIGDEVYVIITVKSSELIKGFNAYFTYDNRILRFVTGGSVVHGNDDEFQIDDTERSVSATKITYSIKFIARNRGSTSISLKKGFEVTADNDTSSNLSVSYTPLVVVVKENQAEKTASPKKTKEPKETATPEVSASSVPSKDPETASPKPTPSKNDIIGSNKLRKLSIGEGVSLAPDFSPEIKKYSAIVTTDEKTLPITYETEDSLAEVVIKGNKKLTEGKNTIKIAVTGTNGKKRVYKLSVTIQKTADSGKGANKLTVSKKNGKTYLLGNTTIQLLTPGKDVIPSGFTETEIEIGGKTVTAYALENSKESSFVLLYGKGNKKELYLYDKTENTLMPYEKVKSWYRSLDGDSVFGLTEQEKTVQSLKYVVGIMAAFCGLMALFAISAILRSKR